MSAVQRVQLRKASEVTHSRSFADALEDGLYQGYTYSYPHKTAYRWFQEPLVLADVWAAQDLSNTFLYAHIPFCEMRCGFCNLFTTTNPSDERESQFVAALNNRRVWCARFSDPRCELRPEQSAAVHRHYFRTRTCFDYWGCSPTGTKLTSNRCRSALKRLRKLPLRTKSAYSVMRESIV